MRRRPFPRHIFRAYDIRGRADGPDPDLTTDLAHDAGRAYADLLRRDWNTRRAVIGGDERATTPALRGAIMQGLRDGGVDVIDLGRATSPLTYWASATLTQRGDPCGGAMITASHNPHHDNGIKLLQPGGMPILPDAIRAIGDQIERGAPAPPAATRGEHGSWDPITDYAASLAQRYRLATPLRIALDPGGGVAARTAPIALKACGAQVDGINLTPDPTPPRPADPQHADNMRELCDYVRASGAEIGIAFDGDGDRIGMVDRRGHRIPPDQLFALLAQDWLARHPAAQIQVDVKTSQAVIDHIHACGGRAVFGPVGHSLGKHAMAGAGIDFGGEASTHYFQRIDDPPHITDDAVRTACWLAQIAAEADEALDDLIDAIPRYRTSPEIRLPCPDDRKFDAARHIRDACAARWPVLDLDGVRADLSDIAPGGWALVRASNTSPVLTVVLEARTNAGYDAVRQTVIDIIDQAGLDPSPLNGLE